MMISKYVYTRNSKGEIILKIPELEELGLQFKQDGKRKRSISTEQVFICREDEYTKKDENKKQDMQTEYDQLQEKLDEYNLELQNKEQEIKQIQEKNSKQDELVQQLRNKIEKLENTIQEQENIYKQAENENKKLVDEYTKKIDEKGDKLAKKIGECENLEAENKEIYENLGIAKDILHEHQLIIMKYETQIEAYNKLNWIAKVFGTPKLELVDKKEYKLSAKDHKIITYVPKEEKTSI